MKWHKYFLISFNHNGRMNLLRASTLERLGDLDLAEKSDVSSSPHWQNAIIAITVHEELI